MNIGYITHLLILLKYFHSSTLHFFWLYVDKFLKLSKSNDLYVNLIWNIWTHKFYVIGKMLTLFPYIAFYRKKNSNINSILKTVAKSKLSVHSFFKLAQHRRVIFFMLKNIFVLVEKLNIHQQKNKVGFYVFTN